MQARCRVWNCLYCKQRLNSGMLNEIGRHTKREKVDAAFCKNLNFSVFDFRWCRRIQRKTCPLKSSGSRSVWIPVFIFVFECALRRATSVTETIKASISIISIHLSMSVSDDIKYSLWNLKYLLVFFKREIERYRERQSHGDKETERYVLFFVSNVPDSYSKNRYWG